MDTQSNKKYLKKHELFILIGVLVVGILVATLVMAATPRQCNDRVDNDGDTRIDYPNDPGCSSPSDGSELSTVQCDDGVDNGDADSFKDYPIDLGCVSLSD